MSQGRFRALINNSVGVNGICRCRLTAYKIFGDQLFDFGIGRTGFREFRRPVDPELYLAALIRSLNDDMNVINLSIGGPGQPSIAESQAFQDLFDNNVVVVAAMGNNNSPQSSFPAAIPGVIAVGATTPSDFPCQL